MPTDYENLRDEIHSIVSGIADIGTVHKYQRFSAERSRFLEFFKATVDGRSIIRAWFITSPSMGQHRQADRGQHMREIKFTLWGFNQLDDTGNIATASEPVFRTLVETVVDALDAKPTLNGKAVGSEPAQIEEFTEVMFGDVLCHRVKIELVYRMIKQITYS